MAKQRPRPTPNPDDNKPPREDRGYGRDDPYEGKPLSREDIEFAWHWLLHEDNLLGSRVNFFLVAESMFLAGFSTLIAANRTDVALVVGAAGIAVAVMWWHLARWTLRKTFWKLRALVRKGKPIYDDVCAGRKSDFAANRVLTEILPLTIAVMWVVLLFLNYSADRQAMEIRTSRRPISGAQIPHSGEPLVPEAGKPQQPVGQAGAAGQERNHPLTHRPGATDLQRP